MKCAYCHKEIDEFEEGYELLDCDGDFIHIKCKPKWDKFCEEINNMSDEEFKNYMIGR